MNELKKFSGAIGIVVLLISMLVSMVKPEFEKYCSIGYGVGFVLMILYIIANYRFLKKQFSGRSAKYGSYMVFNIVLVIFIVGFINAITIRHSKQWDLTENKRFTLADQSVKVLKNLKNDVTAFCFFTDALPVRPQVESLLNQYRHENPMFKIEFIDPRKNPSLAEQHQITKDGTIALVMGSKTERITYPDATTEESITNALVKITRSGTKTVYFSTGHGEKGINDDGENGFSYARKQIEALNYQIKELVLAQQEKVPDDCSILVIAGPTTDFFDAELDIIKKFIDKPGNVIFMINPGEFPKLIGFLNKYGVTLKNTMIIDKVSRVFGGDYLMPLVSTYTEHPISKNLAGWMTFFPIARSVEINPELPKNIKLEKICETSVQSWAETNLEMLEQKQAMYDEGADIAGPIALAVAVTITVNKDDSSVDDSTDDSESKKNTEAQLLIFGDADFADNSYYELQKNGDLFMNSISFLAEEKDLIAIRPKKPNSEPLILTK
ncbi:MAG: hypothetical protein A2161_18495, partial [Candidatus Schekmanbacteria bacterium RBG_13_48_7]